VWKFWVLFRFARVLKPRSSRKAPTQGLMCGL
jgi:hypothetical protein